MKLLEAAIILAFRLVIWIELRITALFFSQDYDNVGRKQTNYVEKQLMQWLAGALPSSIERRP